MDEDGEIHYGREISSQKLHRMKVVLLHSKWKERHNNQTRLPCGGWAVVPCSICMKNAVGRGYSYRYHVAQCHELKDAFPAARGQPDPDPETDERFIPTNIPLCDPCYAEHIDSHQELGRTLGDEHFLFIDPLRRVFVPTGGIYRGND